MPPMSRRLGFFIAAAALAALARTNAIAQVWPCFEPTAPYCMSWIGTFDSAYAISLCRVEADRYRDEVAEFRRCVVASADQALEQFNRNVERFNCRARGSTVCP
jgi:hypothetical protein